MNTRKKELHRTHITVRKKIELYFNGRDHRFSSSSLRKEVAKENNKNILEFNRLSLIDYVVVHR
jgi:hypothetical protein